MILLGLAVVADKDEVCSKRLVLKLLICVVVDCTSEKPGAPAVECSDEVKISAVVAGLLTETGKKEH